MDAHWHVGGSETDTHATYHGHWVKEQKEAWPEREEMKEIKGDGLLPIVAHYKCLFAFSLVIFFHLNY